MTKFDNFFNYANGKVWDKYGRQCNIASPQLVSPFGGQCVSLIKTYLLYLYGNNKVKESYGDAKDYWDYRNSNGILDLCTVVNDLKNGDIVVSTGGDPRFGHVYIYKDGQAFTQNCNSNPKATLYPLNWQGSIVGILRPDILIQNYDLIPEHRIATVKEGHNINVRRENPVGMVVRTAKAGAKIEYTEKCVCFGHRYISWIENGIRLFMAVTPTQEQKDHWVTISLVPTSTTTTTEKQKGIDISAHQGSIDFSKVKSAVKYAIPRCSYGTITDTRFKEYVKGCKANNIPVPGVYVFDYALTDEAAVSEAEHAINLCKEVGLSKDTIIFFDCEYDSVDYAKDSGRNGVGSINKDRTMVQRHTKLFMDKVKAAGYKTGYYTNLDGMNRYYNGFKTNSDEKFWYARPGATPEYDYDYYQYGTEAIPGIAGQTDVNWSSGTVTTTSPSTPAKPTVTESWNRNATANVGSTVRSISLNIAVVPGTNSAFRNECVYIPALGGLVPLDDVTESSDSGEAVDDIISTLAAKVYLKPATVTQCNPSLNLVMVNGYWVNAEPLEVKN